MIKNKEDLIKLFKKSIAYSDNRWNLRFIKRYCYVSKSLPFRVKELGSIYRGNQKRISLWLIAKCPICNYERATPIIEFPKGAKKEYWEEWIIYDDEDVSESVSSLHRSFNFHREARVRLSGCPNHTKMLLEDYGNNACQRLFEIWGKKNIIIGKYLLNISNNLKAKMEITT